MKKVRLYYQCSGDLPVWDFCAHAAFGARQNDVPAIKFETIDSVPNDDHVVLVGSVEESTKWLERGGFPVPSEIDVIPTIPRTAMKIPDLDLRTPKFIKPKGKIKAFTGEVVTKESLEWVVGDYTGDVWVYEPVEFVSEWRCYINCGKIMKVCHYKGSPYSFPDEDYLLNTCNQYTPKLKDKYKSFTLDFGIRKIGVWTTDTILIEGNDAWAIANYGLDGDLYWKFVKDRWLQMTGVLES